MRSQKKKIRMKGKRKYWYTNDLKNEVTVLRNNGLARSEIIGILCEWYGEGDMSYETFVEICDHLGWRVCKRYEPIDEDNPYQEELKDEEVGVELTIKTFYDDIKDKEMTDDFIRELVKEKADDGYTRQELISIFYLMYCEGEIDFDTHDLMMNMIGLRVTDDYRYLPEEERKEAFLQHSCQI